MNRCEEGSKSKNSQNSFFRKFFTRKSSKKEEGRRKEGRSKIFFSKCISWSVQALDSQYLEGDTSSTRVRKKEVEEKSEGQERKKWKKK